MKFGVITEVPPIENGGNLAVAMDILVETGQPHESNDYLGTYERVDFPTLLLLRRPVFNVGELLVLDDDGREIPYPARKPGKWSVTCEEFDTVQAAVNRVVEVMSA
jgi:hypothetical protein